MPSPRTSHLLRKLPRALLLSSRTPPHSRAPPQRGPGGLKEHLLPTGQQDRALTHAAVPHEQPSACQAVTRARSCWHLGPQGCGLLRAGAQYSLDELITRWVNEPKAVPREKINSSLSYLSLYPQCLVVPGKKNSVAQCLMNACMNFHGEVSHRLSSTLVYLSLTNARHTLVTNDLRKPSRMDE